MINYLSLLEDTFAYKSVKAEVESGNLSHAYLIVIPDQAKLKEYLKVFIKLMVCKNGSPCGSCRECVLIDKEQLPDAIFYPKSEGAVLSEDVANLIEESYLKPIEGDKKLLVISSAHTMTAQAQNKLLKTLEEPPKNVHIILGATSEFPLLATIKSRVKKLEINGFSGQKLISALSEDCPDRERLKNAVALGDGTVGKALALYSDENISSAVALAEDMLVNMVSSKEVLKYSTLISALKCDFSDFLDVLEGYYRDLVVYYSGKKELVNNTTIFTNGVLDKGYNLGSSLLAVEKIGQARQRKKFNANATMLTEWLLFQILEGKYKWQKL